MIGAHAGLSPLSFLFKPCSPRRKRSSQISPSLNNLLKTFEVALSERLKDLKPKNRSDILHLPWILLALKALSRTHEDMKALISDLGFPVTEWEERWLDEYMEDSIKLLDVCNALSAELSNLDQDQLLVRYVVHLLDFSGGVPDYNKMSSAKGSLQERLEGSKKENRVDLKRKKIQKCAAILQGMSSSLDSWRSKSSPKGKVFLRAMYGVKVTTIFICGVLTSALLGDLRPLFELQVPRQFLWSAQFMGLQQEVNEEIRSLFVKGSAHFLKELESLDMAASRLLAMLEKFCADRSQQRGGAKAEEIKRAVEDLRQSSELLSQGLDPLAKQVNDFFHTVLTGRTALLDSLRLSGDPAIPKVDATKNKNIPWLFRERFNHMPLQDRENTIATTENSISNL